MSAQYMNLYEEEVISELEHLETVFYTLIQSQTNNFSQFFFISDQYTVEDKQSECSVFISGDDFFNSLSRLFSLVNERHQASTELYIQSLFNEVDEDVLNKSISKVNGYFVHKEKSKINIFRFSVNSPKTKYYEADVKINFFKKDTVQKIRDKNENEIEFEDAYYTVDVSDDPLSEESEYIAKDFIVRVLNKNVSFSDEKLEFKKLERMWSQIVEKGQTTVFEFESFWFPLTSMGENSSPEIQETIESLISQILSLKPFVNQYELCKKYDPLKEIFM